MFYFVNVLVHFVGKINSINQSINQSNFKSFPRQSDGRGGGTGVMCNSRIEIKFINGDEKHSFEYSEWNCKMSNKAIKIIAVYRPPYSQSHAVTSNMFFEEFSSFLESIVMCPEILLITGDFNFHLDDIADEDSRKFIEVLETFGLIQHVKFPTHVSNHILDLIITRSSSEIQASFFLSDHCFVECSLSVPRPNPRQKKLQFRKMRQINIDAFKSDIITSNLCNETWANLNDLVQSYDETLSNILEKHAPVQRNVIMERTKIPWFNNELKHLKVNRRKLERKMLKSNCECDKKLYRASCNKYSAKLKSAERLYYSELMDQCSDDSRKLFKVVSTLSKVRKENPLPPLTDLGQLANDFGIEFFHRKIELLRPEIDDIPVQPPSVEYQPPKAELTSFHQLTEEEIRDIIMNSSNATCKLDPIPTWLVKLCVDELKTVITKIINMSLRDSYVPEE